MMRKHAFTLVETMVVVAIVAIVSAVAFTSYRSSVAKSKWSEVVPCLADTVLRLENYRSNHGIYPTDTPWTKINKSNECSEHYLGDIGVSNDGTQYVVAYFDSNKKIWGPSGAPYDTWVMIDIDANMIHLNNTVDTETDPLTSEYAALLPTPPTTVINP